MFGIGYVSGVKSVNPDITIQQYNANSFGDAAVGSTAAVDMVTKGADVIYHAAGGTGGGVISACQQEGIYAIGFFFPVVPKGQARIRTQEIFPQLSHLIKGMLQDSRGGRRTWEQWRNRRRGRRHHQGLGDRGTGAAGTSSAAPGAGTSEASRAMGADSTWRCSSWPREDDRAGEMRALLPPFSAEGGTAAV